LIIKTRIFGIKRFLLSLKHGLHIELNETIEIPTLLINKDYYKALIQIGDLFKMFFLGLLWIVPGGGILTVLILKYLPDTRPSAFKI